MKRVAIIGKGTAGVLSAVHFSTLSKLEKYEVSWYYDPSTPPQAVGEGTTGDVVDFLRRSVNFTWNDLPAIDGNFKTGVRKLDWTTPGSDFNHIFPPPLSSLHFNAIKMQEFLEDRIKKLYPLTSITHGNVSHDTIDADYIIDCSGKPAEIDDQYQTTDYIYLNAVHVTQCFWSKPEFYDTLAIARPYGWVFAIPLQNRCSIGYMYNSKFNTLDEVKEDVKEVFKRLHVTPSDTTNSFEFKNYFRSKNFSDRVAYNGNASFFLEPMEATSISTMMRINNLATSILKKELTVDQANYGYYATIMSMQTIINLHYMNNTTFNTPFWNHARAQSTQYIAGALVYDGFFRDKIKATLNNNTTNHTADDLLTEYYGVWPLSSFPLNIDGLGIRNILKDLYVNSESLVANR